MIEYLLENSIKTQLANLKQIVFEVTDSCNLKCKYCGYGEFYNNYDKRENKKLSVNKAIKLIDYLVSFWKSDLNTSSNRNVYISFYGGEPLLNIPFIKKIVHYVEKIKLSTRHFTFSLTTNALLLDKCIEFLVEKDFNLLISLDGDSNNNDYRLDKSGRSSFKRVIQNVNLLQKKYPNYFIKNVNFNAVLHNKNSVTDIHNFFIKYNKKPIIGELNSMGIRPAKINTFMQSYRNQHESLYQSENYEEIEKERFPQTPNYIEALRFIHIYSGFVYDDYNELLYGKYKNTWLTGTCSPFYKKMFLTVNGKILPCERIGHNFVLGNVSNKEFSVPFSLDRK